MMYFIEEDQKKRILLRKTVDKTTTTEAIFTSIEVASICKDALNKKQPTPTKSDVDIDTLMNMFGMKK